MTTEPPDAERDLAHARELAVRRDALDELERRTRSMIITGTAMLGGVTAAVALAGSVIAVLTSLIVGPLSALLITGGVRGRVRVARERRALHLQHRLPAARVVAEGRRPP